MRHLTGFLICLGLVALFSFSSMNAHAEDAKKEEMKSYTVEVPYTDIAFDMLPIPGGVYKMGSPENEKDRADDESPVHQVKIEPFWMAKFEATWDEYDTFRYKLDTQRRKLSRLKETERDKKGDAVTRPTKEYRDMTFGMGHDGFPASCMTQLAAKAYCQWLTEITGDFYRLPTEAEWEYACRAGTTTAYSFGDNTDNIDDYAWYFDNADEKYQKVGQKKPNPWGLYDMHGNVAEWCLDQYVPDFYAKSKSCKPAVFPVVVPTTLYPRVVRGGSWDDDPDLLRSAAREKSNSNWKIRDPQLPKSIWYHTDATHVGFRVIRPLKRPTAEEIKKYAFERDPAAELK
ncbi:MAG: SUMF1/EgtB/PvdO family nonheme iron enzyme [Planctomycetaceae bacterium]|nr:SUMF1/EgtB/PvdO family nonheme iron enzyme [Planctomycetaceae bacterium]